jgi:hypothetical protein
MGKMNAYFPKPDNNYLPFHTVPGNPWNLVSRIRKRIVTGIAGDFSSALHGTIRTFQPNLAADWRLERVSLSGLQVKSKANADLLPCTVRMGPLAIAGQRANNILEGLLKLVAIPGFGSSKFKKAAKLSKSLLFLPLE